MVSERSSLNVGGFEDEEDTFFEMRTGDEESSGFDVTL